MLPQIIKDKVDNVLYNVVDAIDAGFSILDKDLHIVCANGKLSSILNLGYDPIGKTCREVYKCECKENKYCSVLQALSSGKKQFSETQLITERGERRYIQNISTPVKDEKNNITHLLKLSINVTAQEEKIRQLSLLRKLAELMQGTLQIDRLLHLILTCVTAGTALGFNRARLFLVDKERNIVYGKMAVGPSNLEEANRIWSDIAKQYEELEDLIKASEDNYRDDTPLHMIKPLMAYLSRDENEVIVSCVKNKKIIWERNAFHNPNIDKKFVTHWQLSVVLQDQFYGLPIRMIK